MDGLSMPRELLPRTFAKFGTGELRSVGIGVHGLFHAGGG
jgi:hypothetical protein